MLQNFDSRLIVFGVCQEDGGFTSGSIDFVDGSDELEDYKKEVDSETFERWWEKAIAANDAIPDGAVMVIDNCRAQPLATKMKKLSITVSTHRLASRRVAKAKAKRG